MWFKVCGITAAAEVRLLARQGVDAVGIWYGVPSGPYELPLGDVPALARAAGAAGLEPVLVTLLDERHLSPALAGDIRGAWDMARRHAALQEVQHALPG